MKLLDFLEKKLGRNFGINNLMLYIVILNFVLYFIDYMPLGLEVYNTFALIPSEVFRGQVWRLITFIFIPPMTSPIFIAFVLYFYYMIGSTLESTWGIFRFNFFYFIGVLGTIIASLITGFTATPVYLNLSLFLAFALLYPNFQVYIFFILPVKMKWLAILDVIFLSFSFLFGGFSTKIFIIVSLINIIIFFGKMLFSSLKHTNRRKKYQRSVEPKVINTVSFHKCTVCGITEKDNPDMQFRYCSKCNGAYEYCMDHLYTHEHITE